MSAIPETKYTKTEDGVYIAYQTVGDGPLDLIYCPDWITHLEASWDYERHASFLRRLSSFSRLVLFDKRGIGLSDPVPPNDAPSLEAWMDDVRAVLDACGSGRPAILGYGHGGLMAMLFAATYPERTAALVLVNAYARLSRAPDYPWGYPQRVTDIAMARLESEWGTTGFVLDVSSPSLARDPSARQWWCRRERLACSPRTAVALARATYEQDARHALPAITAATLVLQVADNRHVRAGHGRYLADHIAGARYVELPGEDHWFWAGPSADQATAEIVEFLTGAPAAVESDRVLATMLFTDIVDSTRLATEFGDHRWRELLDSLDAMVGRQLERFRGRLVKSTGDGHLATFDGPGRAIQCAVAVRDGVRGLGLEVRSGLHTGEIEVRGNDVGGIAVHLAERVSAQAGAGEVVVSRTVVDLVAGSGIEFQDRGAHVLKGVSGEWQLFAVER
jgi:class 3 adenylate cyclase